MSSVLELEKEAEQFRQEGEYAKAAEKLNELLHIDESFVRAHLALSVVYHLLGEYDNAIAHGERACQIEPSEPFNFTALSVTYQRAFVGTQDPKYIQMAEDARDRALSAQQG